MRLVERTQKPSALAFGQWPDNPHEVPQWRLDLERRAEARGAWLHPVRTRADYERQIALCTSRLEADMAALTIAEPLEPAEAARKFLRWIRETSRCGQFTDDELSNAYIEHCKATRVAPSSEAHMRKHLIAMAGVHKGTVEDRSSPKRRRPTVWTIDEGLSQTMRRAA